MNSNNLAIPSADSAPTLPAPVPPRGPLSAFKFLKLMRENGISPYPQEAYEQDIVEMKMFGRRRFLLCEPAAVKRVLLDNSTNYRKTELLRRLVQPALGNGLLTSEGEVWKAHRRIMTPAFDLRSVASYIPVMTEAAEHLATEWRSRDADDVVDVATAMMELTLQVISRTMFSSDSDEMATIIERGTDDYQSRMRPNIGDFIGMPAWLAGIGRKRLANRALGKFDALIERLIAERSKNPDHQAKDLLSRLIEARDVETGNGMTTEEVRDHVITIFMAGHETTALALTWTWYLLSQHPRVEQQLHSELGTVLAGRTPVQEDVSKLTYTRMVIEESMRMYPPAHTLARVALADDTLCGHKVPKGSTVMIVPWLLHRHVKLWQNPDQFIPERFSPEQSAQRARFSYLPFGGGKRICIGAAFALTEATLLLATLANRCRLTLALGHPVEPHALITLRARHGMRMHVSSRA